MHRLLRTALLAGMLVAATPRAAQSYDTDSLLEVYAAAISRHTSFQAPFTQSRYIAMFEQPLVSTGTISFSHPGSIKLHYRSPFEAAIVLREGDMQRYRRQDGAWVAQPSLEIVTKAITGEMARWFAADFTSNFPYDVSVVADNPRHLRLRPRNAAAKTLFEAIELRFPEEPDYIEKVKLIETSGDSIVIEHGTPSFEPLEEKIFTIDGK
ncbi:MAG: hypothetical protein GF331_23925 [Chitinivibrionales bacterium]|nr:hypothetical protein [Chitinivibrionales bacterium]